MIGLLGEGNVSYVLPAHSEMGILTQGILTWEKVTLIKKNRKGCIKKAFYMLEVLLEVKIYQIISFIP